MPILSPDNRMMSIHTFLHAPKDSRTDALNRVISILLQGMALHSFCHDEPEYANFQRSLRRLREEIQSVRDEDTALILAGSAIRTLEEHSNSAMVAVAAKQRDLEDALELVSQSLLTVSQCPEEDAAELKKSEKQLTSACTVAEVAAAQARLSACLERIRLHVQRAKEAAQMPSRAGTSAETDPVTGLPDSRIAMDAVAAVWSQRQHYCAALFGAQRLSTVSARYGFQAGDEMLRVMTQHLEGYFEHDHLLFRWRGPCLLALLDRRAGDARLTADLQRLVSVRLEHTISKNSRQITLPVSICWGMVPLEASGIEDMIQHLDDFSVNRLYQER